MLGNNCRFGLWESPMARETSPEMDDELFNEVYGKAYTGPVVVVSSNETSTNVNLAKRPYSVIQSDEEDESRDPNAVPTDFTSREAKVWEAKAKATERNWKKRKEEEMICKICGDAGHFTQGCPSTLGGGRKNADFFERVPARDKLVRELFSQKVISEIERDVGCKIRMDKKFLFVSAKDRLVMSKGVDVVHKIIQEGKERSAGSSTGVRSKSPEPSTRDPQLLWSGSQRSNSPRNASRSLSRGFSSERNAVDHIRDADKFSTASPQARAYGKYEAKGRPTQSKSPRRPNVGDAFRPYDGDNQFAAFHKPSRWSDERHGTDYRCEGKLDPSSYPQNLEELEMEFSREVTELSRARDEEEDEENKKHRETLAQLRENYQTRLRCMRSAHEKQWEEFHQLSTSVNQQQSQEIAPYSQPGFPDYNQRNIAYMSSGSSTDPRTQYPYPGDGYPSGPRPDLYAGGNLQRQRDDDFMQASRRY